jgi:hypothetical protein
VRGVPEEEEGEGLAGRRIAAPASRGDMRQELGGVPARGGYPCAAHRFRFLLQELLRVRAPGGPGLRHAQPEHLAPIYFFLGDPD